VSTTNKATHEYRTRTHWTGNTGAGTSDYRAYERAHVNLAHGKPPIEGSSDPSFRGDPRRYNPEELLVMSLSSCHMLWYLHLCADNGIVVVDYVDDACGVMIEDDNGGGRFVQVTLRPRVKLRTGGDVTLIEALHRRAHDLCFIANSVNFPVLCEPSLEFLTVSPV